MSVTRLLQLQASRLGIAGASFGRLKSLKEATSKLSSALESLQPLPDDQQADTAAVTFCLHVYLICVWAPAVQCSCCQSIWEPPEAFYYEIHPQ